MDNSSNILDYVKGLPEIVTAPAKTSTPNSKILIHKGKYKITQGSESLEIDGKIEYNWLPNPSSIFSGKVLNATKSSIDMLLSDDETHLYLQDVLFSECLITLSRTDYIEGVITSNATKGDSSVPVSKVRFSIPNLRSLGGEPVKSYVKKGTLRSKGRRIQLVCDPYTIKIDKNPDFEDQYKSLKNQGGYMILHSGELTTSKRNIKYSDAKEICLCLSSFLTFLNGRRCSPYFLQGLGKSKIIWTDYSNYKVDSYKPVTSWIIENNFGIYSELWQKFYPLWKNDEGKDFLNTVIHWYTEANSNSGFVEGSLIMAQAALELIYNWLIVEKENIIIGKDSETISAANKIRILLSHVKIDARIPDSLEHLKKVQSQNSELSDAPEVIVSIRNAIVHSNKTKREKLPKIPFMARYEACDLCLKYVELSLLFILNYKSNYFNRCSGANWEGEGIEIVPWIKGE